MLLYLANANPAAPDNVLYDVSNNPVYEFKTRCIWKSESPAVPHITQTEIVEAQSKQVIAQIDWDAGKPIYIDFGNGDERVVSDMLYPKSFGENQLAFQTPGDLRWTLTHRSMELQSELASGALARYCPSSRVSSEGTLQYVSSTSKSRSLARDWLEINLIEFSPLSFPELLVDFVILETFRRLSFWIPDPESSVSAASSPTSPSKSRTRSSGGSTLPRIRLRQVVS